MLIYVLRFVGVAKATGGGDGDEGLSCPPYWKAAYNSVLAGREVGENLRICVMCPYWKFEGGKIACGGLLVLVSGGERTGLQWPS